ncbi:MAG: elongation factor 4 [Candidatus Lambdaproteobacteria bacterium RIFOXYD1_FULL_56_27]|uniref:Elongation factor 4 n=1 Tax=Candidatus Lambdaproteobacteria bacterium RIFOXYD2_FULL_56_26 TaxID=1817773 RepID=A0A1F6GSZ2_9PROT|nr:MAG: elongation factor 4 [Candidatus Lambdaproteobacteria bacterium RIFOXYC1_FULL_56_13]OGH01275.1 MAG: elongation factor 4 [Candidatus Lambdaproteobacteria bacterium RIFOXYD2_FULL_56_26]OGH06252.1 MAG: elongation factor 4 [Candidatus Lambdaproteobacteria bacterium RIFOXYD1_FULL_56_27]
MAFTKEQQSRIRNFCIIAHIDHGKSTLADRILDFTGAIEDRQKQAQFLDNMDIERERGITIKAQSVALNYKALDGKNYQLNLIDTPGHVDFTYEVSRSIAACEGALLVVDAAQGVEAQTLANVYLALDHNLEILPVLNKIDLPAADPDKVALEIEEVIGLDASEAVRASAKAGIGIREILEQIVKKVPAPTGDLEKPLQALIFDSWFDPYLGIVALFRVMQGVLPKNEVIKFMVTGKEYLVTGLGKFTPFKTEVDALHAGEVGYLHASIKNIKDVKIGDTITTRDYPAKTLLQGYHEAKPMVFAGIYPVDSNDYEDLKEALGKLILNDSAITYEPETSIALGFGYRCGFLGLLHMEIVQERLEREFDLSLLITSPTVVYHVHTVKGQMLKIENPAELPDPTLIDHIEEPFILGNIILPSEYIGTVMKLALERRGIQRSMDYIGEKRVSLKFEMPLNEIVYNFYDQLKSITQGYASFDYEFLDYRTASLVKMDILLNGEVVDALSVVIHREKAYFRGRELVKKLKELIPRQMFEIAIQAAIGAKIIARESIGALRKNVTAKCYGGDISRKRKLLEKQKKGKKRMKQLGNVDVPQEAFLAILKLGDDS